MTYLTDAEVEAPLEAPEQATRTGRRDHAIMETFIATGLRAGELTALTDQDRKLTKPSHLVVRGKGRKDRITPLNRATVTTLGRWRDENPNQAGASPLFSAQGSTRPTSVDAIAARIHAHVATAEATRQTLTGKNISPHTLRHTCAMRMLAAGINITTIALWLGHESTEPPKRIFMPTSA